MSQEFTFFMREVGRRKVFSPEEELKVSRLVVDGDLQARKMMAEHNMRLVVSICKPYASMGFAMEDLFQEGCIGLMRAVDRFDPERGFKFSTYATWWIKQAVHRYMGAAGGNTIRIPARLRAVKRKIEARMQQEDQTLEEAAATLEIPLEDAMEAIGGPRASISLDAAVSEDGHEGRHASVPDPNATDPADAVTESFSMLREGMRRLPPQQREILELRFGFGGPVHGRNEIAAGLGISAQVVKKEQARALAALAKGSVSGGRDPR